MPCGHLNAMRFAQKPLAQPGYPFVHVPKATSDLQHSSLQLIENREHFQTCMAEMLLLGKEALRRRHEIMAASSTSTSSSSTNSDNKTKKCHDNVETNSLAKPLSLEYLADRMDVDDPCFGYLVRTKAPPSISANAGNASANATNINAAAAAAAAASAADSSEEGTDFSLSQQQQTSPQQQQNTLDSSPNATWKEGMLQGFITVTTFTNWQKTFRWDSLHPDAFNFDPPALKKQRIQGIRKWDSTGELAHELQQSVHYGDIWNEGIVWPRIAEISLLGALGCGRTLVKLVLEQLENLKPNGERNYDYVILQATDNSIPFYESLGFVRVGGVMEDKNANSNNEDEGDATPSSSSREPRTEIVTSNVTTYVTKKRGEQPLEIAKKLKSDVWDIIFLNKGLFAETITPTSRLLLETTLHVPVPAKKGKRTPTRVSSRLATPCDSTNTNNEVIESNKDNNNEEDDNEDENIEWYIAKENDTPTRIAKQFNVSCQALIKANAARLPGLMGKSRLKAGTRVQVSHFHIVTKAWTAYAHWSFPDDQMEDGEPSYMMCYKLNRRKGRKAAETCSPTPVLDSLKAELEDYTPTPLLLPPTPEKDTKVKSKTAGRTEKGAAIALSAATCAEDDSGGTIAQVGKNLTTIMEAAAASPMTTDNTISAATKQPEASGTSILVARDTNRDTLVQVKVTTEGTMVKPSPVPVTLSDSGASQTAINLPDTPTDHELKPPKRAVSSFVFFCQDMRKRKQHLLEGLSVADASKVLADRWQKAPRKVKQQFEQLAAEARRVYFLEKEIYDTKLAEQKRCEPKQQQQPQIQRRDSLTSNQSARSSLELIGVAEFDDAKNKKQDHEALYNKIVKIKPEAIPFTVTARPKRTESDSSGKDDRKADDPTMSPDLQPDIYKYWFVYTYIPDLKWCHLVPLIQVGEFTAEDKKIRLIGRPKWKLVNESLCQEIDISSRYVIPVKSRETKRSTDADKEEWVIVDQDEEDTSSEEGSRSSARKSIEGKRGRKRKNPSSTSSPAKARSSKKRAKESPSKIQPTPAPAETTVSNPHMPAALTGEDTQKSAPSEIEFTLPPMNLDLSSLEPATLSKSNSESNSRCSGGSESPSTPESFPPCTCGSGGHCSVHHPPQYQYVGPYHHHYRPAHRYPVPYPYRPPQEYPHHESQRLHHYQRPPPPPPGWPSHAPFPPPGPYPPQPQEHRYHYQYPPERPPHHHYHVPPPHGSSGHYSDEPYYPPPYPAHPPLLGTPCHPPSAAHLELSVEREVAL